MILKKVMAKNSIRLRVIQEVVHKGKNVISNQSCYEATNVVLNVYQTGAIVTPKILIIKYQNNISTGALHDTQSCTVPL